MSEQKKIKIRYYQDKKPTCSAVHPLLNPASPHYQMCDGVEAIERMEQMYTKQELMIWAKCNVMKYRLRIGKKDDVIQEAKKIDTYEAYYKYLESAIESEKESRSEDNRINNS